MTQKYRFDKPQLTITVPVAGLGRVGLQPALLR
jgi:hypothetical protein